MEEGASTPLIKCKSERGEATVQDDNGASDFEALWSAMRWKPQSGDARRCSLYRREYIALGVNSTLHQGLWVRARCCYGPLHGTRSF